MREPWWTDGKFDCIVSTYKYLYLEYCVTLSHFDTVFPNSASNAGAPRANYTNDFSAQFIES